MKLMKGRKGKKYTSKSQTIELAKKITEGVLAKAVDAILVMLFFGLEFEPRELKWKTGENIADDLETFNYETIKNSLRYLKGKGLIKIAKEKSALAKITKQGKERLKSILPIYQERRIWDKRVYLVTYDLPVSKNKERNYLRNFLKRIGCGMLQESVWITPYNPTKLIEEFAGENYLDKELILVSSLGENGTIGGMDLAQLMEKVYHLKQLNERYKNFLSSLKENEEKNRVVFKYLSILSDDPQLPFELLPEDWVGEEAYYQFQKILI
jgi:phenylacetic acid degradation operon negative regulatory protein